MQLKRCEHGHYYDPQKYTTCPHCAAVQQAPAAPDVTRVKSIPSIPAPVKDEEEITVRYQQTESEIVPPVGWLVCIQGPAKGKDYQIHAERNRVGRGSDMDIVLKGDNGISRENHFVISYNPRAITFALIPEEGKSIVYVNGKEVLQPIYLHAFDRIELSRSAFLFVPFCGEVFHWE